jgi:hypothetical protein
MGGDFLEQSNYSRLGRFACCPLDELPFITPGSRALLDAMPLGDIPRRECPGVSSPKAGDALEEVVDSPERVPRVPFDRGEPGPAKAGGTAVKGFPSYKMLPEIVVDSKRVEVVMTGVLNEGCDDKVARHCCCTARKPAWTSP